jgi:hypothetical protein
MTPNKFGLRGPYTKTKRQLLNWRRMGCFLSVLIIFAFWGIGVYGWYLAFWHQ